jgi:PAS domain S-box-containing protein
VTELSRAQLQAWDTSLQMGTTTRDDPRAGTARLRGRLRNALACLREAVEAARRLADAVAALRVEVQIERDRRSSLMDRVPVPCLLTSPDGTIQEVNPAACAALGVSARALVGRDALIFFDDRDAWRQLLAQTAVSRVGSQRHGRMRPRERLQVTVTADLSYVHTLSGDAIQWILTRPAQIQTEAARVIENSQAADA